MKTSIKIIYISIFSLVALIANAQSDTDNRHLGTPFVSKGIVKFSNKNAITTLGLKVRSIDHSKAVISKEVHKFKKYINGDAERGNVISKGYPEWIPSKPITRVRGHH